MPFPHPLDPILHAVQIEREGTYEHLNAMVPDELKYPLHLLIIQVGSEPAAPPLMSSLSSAHTYTPASAHTPPLATLQQTQHGKTVCRARGCEAPNKRVCPVCKRGMQKYFDAEGRGDASPVKKVKKEKEAAAEPKRPKREAGVEPAMATRRRSGRTRRAAAATV